MGTHFEREVYWKPTDHILRDIVLSLRVNAEPNTSVQNRLEIPREAMQNPGVRDVKAQVGEPRIMTVCHWESYSQPKVFSLPAQQETFQPSHLVHSTQHSSPGAQIPSIPESEIQNPLPRHRR